MKRSKTLILTALIMLVAGASLAFAADTAGKQPSQYGLGDQTMSIDAGLYVPLFLLPTGTPLLSGSPSHLSLGVVGGLTWAAYVSPQIRLGLEIAGDWTVSPNNNSLLMLPFIARASYILTAYPFEFPLTFGVGMNIVKYAVDMTTIDLLLRPGVSGLWIFNSSWSFGLNLNWWFDMQFAPTQADSRIGNFLEVTLSALYHF